MPDFELPHEKKICDNLVYKAEQIKHRPYRRWNSEFGMIASLGGVIIIPILLGIWIGGYLDENLPQRFSWRLSLLFVGAVWGAFNAYWWLKIEEDKIRQLDKDCVKKQGEENE
ncbi:MAG: AtpZ/AtpI family protein [Alphaproteobacteria bacterium]|nr:AtpZ/AtpI family protein [Alphaproteobacteria bacterium]